MNSLLIEGTRLLAPTIVAAAKSIPAAQLARFGLLRGPLVGIGPVAGAFVGGAVATAFMVPSARKWMAERAKDVAQWAQDQWKSGEEDDEAEHSLASEDKFTHASENRSANSAAVHA